MLEAGDTVVCRKGHCVNSDGLLEEGISYLIAEVMGHFLKLHHSGDRNWHRDRFTAARTNIAEYSPYYEAITGG